MGVSGAADSGGRAGGEVVRGDGGELQVGDLDEMLVHHGVLQPVETQGCRATEEGSVWARGEGKGR